MPGTLIALEGIDGSGTTTQTDRLTAALRFRGHKVTATREPTISPIGTLIRQMIQGGDWSPKALALLFAADRAQHVEEVIAPALADGHVVIVDRYILSSWAYQSISLPLGWVQVLSQPFPWPARTFLLNLEPEAAMGRVDGRGMAKDMYERLDVQRAAAAGYDRSLGVAPGVVVVDGGLSVEQITAQLVDSCAELGL